MARTADDAQPLHMLHSTSIHAQEAGFSSTESTQDQTVKHVSFLRRGLGPIVQEAGAALLLQDHMHLVVRAGADGVHLSTPDLLEEALGLLHPQDRIVGCAGLRARHDAMEAAEAGCDYVMFGEPFADGGHLPITSVIERGQWWAELFQTPCVVYVPDPKDVSAAAATGAEFVALGDGLLMDPQQVPALVSQALKDIADAPAPVSTGRI